MIAMRVSEAYSVLRDPRRRRAYDTRLSGDGRIRIQLSEASDEAERRDASERERPHAARGAASTSWRGAICKRRDFAAAARNLQTALTFEPDNALFRSSSRPARPDPRSHGHRSGRRFDSAAHVAGILRRPRAALGTCRRRSPRAPAREKDPRPCPKPRPRRVPSSPS